MLRIHFREPSFCLKNQLNLEEILRIVYEAVSRDFCSDYTWGEELSTPMGFLFSQFSLIHQSDRTVIEINRKLFKRRI